jgi:hypothetical protein
VLDSADFSPFDREMVWQLGNSYFPTKSHLKGLIKAYGDNERYGTGNFGILCAEATDGPLQKNFTWLGSSNPTVLQPPASELSLGGILLGLYLLLSSLESRCLRLRILCQLLGFPGQTIQLPEQRF